MKRFIMWVGTTVVWAFAFTTSIYMVSASLHMFRHTPLNSVLVIFAIGFILSGIIQLVLGWPSEGNDNDNG